MQSKLDFLSYCSTDEYPEELEKLIRLINNAIQVQYQSLGFLTSKEQQQELTNHYSSFQFPRRCDGRDRGKVQRTTKAILSLSRLVVFVETSQTLPAILFFTAIAYKQNRIVAINETQTLILCLQVERARSKMLCAVDYIFNLLCAFNCLQPMKKFVFSVASRATVRLQIKLSGSGDENDVSSDVLVRVT